MCAARDEFCCSYRSAQPNSNGSLRYNSKSYQKAQYIINIWIQCHVISYKKKIESHKLTANLPSTANVYHHPGRSGLAQPWLRLHAILSSARHRTSCSKLAWSKQGHGQWTLPDLCLHSGNLVSIKKPFLFCNLQQNFSKPILCGSSTCQCVKLRHWFYLNSFL